jgi:hypothetical protein
VLKKLSDFGRIDFIPNDFFKRLTKNLISDETLDSINALMKNDFDGMALDLMRCDL